MSASDFWNQCVRGVLSEAWEANPKEGEFLTHSSLLSLISLLSTKSPVEQQIRNWLQKAEAILIFRSHCRFWIVSLIKIQKGIRKEGSPFFCVYELLKSPCKLLHHRDLSHCLRASLQIYSISFSFCGTIYMRRMEYVLWLILVTVERKDFIDRR